jgi:hypothetical protein
MGDRPRGGPEGVAVGTLSHADLEKIQKREGGQMYPVSHIRCLNTDSRLDD